MSTNFDIDCRYFPILADLLFRETFRYKPYFNPEEAGFQIFINSYIEYDHFAGSSVVASGKVSVSFQVLSLKILVKSAFVATSVTGVKFRMAQPRVFVTQHVH